MVKLYRDTLSYLRRYSAGFFLVLIMAALSTIGLVALSSAGRVSADNPYSLLRRQSIWLGIAIAVCFFIALVDFTKLRKYLWWIYGFLMLLLILVLIPGIGVSVNGARRWLDLGLMRFQVSDLAKVAMIFALAHYLSSNQRNIPTFLRGFILPSLLILAVSGLVVLEPDFGNAFLCGLVGFSLLFLVGVRLWYLLPTCFFGVSLFSLAVYLDPVRLRRITSFLDVEANRSDSSYQLWQSILAFGAGGTSGVGLGNGRQQLSYLPEAHTDFILPVIGEELGLWTTLTIAMLFLVLFLCVLLCIRKAPDLFQFTLMMGAVLFITFQALINMGVVTGLLPTKGISLPFISYGGSNLVVMFIMCGIILNCLRVGAASPLLRPREL